MMPLWDNNPRHAVPWVTIGFIGACILAFLYQLSAPSFHNVVLYGGFIPARLFAPNILPLELLSLSSAPVLTLLTSMFLHGDIMHILGNMLFLWTFGDNLELVLGRLKFIVFYLFCGLAAAMTQAFINPASIIPMIGASGAISGVLGAYLVLFPKVRVTTYMPYAGIVQLPALAVLGSWFGYQLILGISSLGNTGGGVAFWAHIGGFVAGLIGMFLLKTVANSKNIHTEYAPAEIYANRKRNHDEPDLW